MAIVQTRIIDDVSSRHFYESTGSQLREIFGRGFNTQNELYMLPADEEEQDRLNIQHRASKLTLGGLYTAPDLVRKALEVQGAERPAIIDIGTGSGIWATEMATEYPNADVLGIDLVYPPTLRYVPTNCRFEVLDVNEDLSRFEGTFSVVHMRSVAMGIVDFEETLIRIAKILRPGGVLLLGGGSNKMYSEPKDVFKSLKEGDEGWSAVHEYLELVNAVQFKNASTAKLESHTRWREWLGNSGLYENFEQEDFYIPMGPWKEGMDRDAQEASRLMCRSLENMIISLKPMVLAEGHSLEYIEDLLRKCDAQIKEMRPKTYALWSYAWATRS